MCSSDRMSRECNGRYASSIHCSHLLLLLRLLQGPSKPMPLLPNPKNIYCLRNSSMLRELFNVVLSDDRVETNASSACQRMDESCTNCLRECSAAGAERALCCERRCRSTEACRAAGSRACVELSRPFCASGELARLNLHPVFEAGLAKEFACHLRAEPQRAPLALHAPLFRATFGVDVPRLQFSSSRVSSSSAILPILILILNLISSSLDEDSFLSFVQYCTVHAITVDVNVNTVLSSLLFCSVVRRVAATSCCAHELQRQSRRQPELVSRRVDSIRARRDRESQLTFDAPDATKRERSAARHVGLRSRRLVALRLLRLGAVPPARLESHCVAHAKARRQRAEQSSTCN